MPTERELQDRLAQVHERIAAAARNSGRRPEDVRLVAVSKTIPPEPIAVLARLGVRDFGENRVEEAEEKLPAIQALLGPKAYAACRWSLIGHLQSRKAARAVQLFDEIQSVDSARLAERLERVAHAAGKQVPILLEANISGEESKFGLPAVGCPEDRDATARLFAEIEAILAQPHLRVQGLMTVAPIAADPEVVRPVFRRLRALRDALARHWPAAGWQELSMGMSDDYEVAIAEGATIIRLGRAIFGPRS